MNKHSLFKKTLASLAASTFILSPAASVFAATTSANTINEFLSSSLITDANGDLYYSDTYFQNANSFFSENISYPSFTTYDFSEINYDEEIISPDELPASGSGSESSSSGFSSSSGSLTSDSGENSDISSDNSSSSSTSSNSSSSSQVTSDSSLDPLDDALYDHTIEAFVERLYALVHNRHSDATGLAHWINKLKSGEYTAAGVLKFFFESPEYTSRNTSNEEYLETLYLTMMGRSSDKGGFNFWINYLNSGISRTFLLQRFIISPEFTSICNSYGVTRGSFGLTENRDRNPETTIFVYNIYKDVYGREASISDLNSWTGKLIEGNETVSNLLLKLFTSSEFTSRGLSDEEFINVAYRSFFGRNSDASGHKFWLSLLKNGSSRRLILSRFSDSSEFIARCKANQVTPGRISVTENRDKNTDITSYVKSSFEMILGRNIDTTALNYYTGYLINGNSTKSYLAALFTSSEFIARNLPNQQIVEIIYKVMLQRSADAGGFAHYFSYLERGASPVYIIAAVGSSSEFSNVCKRYGISVGGSPISQARDKNIDVTDVAMNAYLALYNRKPTISELNALCSNLMGKDSDTILRNLFNLTTTQEFKNRNLNKSDYITSIFTTLCGRAPSASELATWQSLLSTDNSSTRESVFFLLGKSSTCSSYLGPKLGFSTFGTQEKGIDVSAHQGSINWAQVASEGYTFAIIRAVSSNNTSSSPVIDPYFYQNVRGARAAGLKVGVYIYSYAKTTDYVSQEVTTALNAIKVLEKEGYRFEYPIVLDMEEFGTSGPNWTQIALVGLAIIDQKGYYPCLYSYANAFKNGIFDMNALAGYDFWVAHYGVSAMSYPGSIWQYTSSGSVGGVSGRCDLNISYRDFSSVIRASGKNNLS